MSYLRALSLSVLCTWAALGAVDVAIVASDPWGNKAGSGDPVAFTVTRTGATTAALTVNLAVSGTATPGTDYPAVAGTLTIAAGQAAAVRTITPNTWAPGRIGTPPSIVVSVAAGGYAITAGQGSATAYIAQNSYLNTGGEDLTITMRKVTTTTGGNYELNIPQRHGIDIPVIRGVIISAPGDGGSDTCADFDRWCYDQNWAYLSQKFASDVASKPISALGALAGTSGHPEVQYAPLCARGFSRGGGLAANVAKAYPARTVAFFSRGWALADAVPSAANAAVPGWFDTGNQDGYAGNVRTSFERGRAVGALWCYGNLAGTGHQETGSAELAREFFEACIALRYDYQQGVAGKDPVLGAVTLTALNEASGWVGEHLYGRNRGTWSSIYSAQMPNWHRDFETRNPFVCPLSSFDRTDTGSSLYYRQHSWLPNERIARLWAQHNSQGWDSLALQFPQGAPPYVLNAGQVIPCTLDTGGFPEATRAEFFVDETKVGEDTSAPFTYTYAVSATGGHVLWARASSADGAVRVTGEHAWSRLGYGPRYIRVKPASELGNTAPTISQIPKITLRSGDTTGISIPFTIGDAETTPDNLTVDSPYWRISWPFNGTHSITGTGANRILTVTDNGTAMTDGRFYRGSVKVSDGFLSTEQAFDVEILPAAGVNAPQFINPSNGSVTLNACDGLWSDVGSFALTDADTPFAQVVATFTNSNLAKLPNGNIRLSAWGPVRSFQVRTVPDGWNGTTVHLILSDGVNSTSATSDVYCANVPAEAANEAPWLAIIPDQACIQDSQTAPAMLRLGDLNWHPEELVVTATSSNPTVLPNGNILITTLGNPQFDRARSLVCQPAAGQSGTATITVTVTEPAANPVAPAGPLSATRTFLLTVSPSGALPTVTLTRSTASIVEATGVSTVTATLSSTSASSVVVTLTASGMATGGGTDYTLSSTTITIPAGQLTGTATVTAVQDSVVEGGETVVLNITGVSNATESGTQQVTVTILDDDVAPLPTVTLGASVASIAEAAGVSTVTATLSSASASNVVVTLTASGTATGGGTDYTLSSSTITITAGQLTGTATVTAVQDVQVDPAETVTLDITSVSNATESGTQQVTVTILDDDLPTVTLGVSVASIAEAAGVSTVTATLSTASTSNVVVTLTASGTATGGGTDYALSSSTITIPAGQLTGTATVTAVQDVLVDPAETVILDITGVSNATESGTQQVTITILDDDLPTVTLAASVASIAEAAGVSTVTATLSSTSASNVVVTLTASGTATGGGTDYTLSSSTITIPAGQLTGTATVTAVQDVQVEGDETVILDISGVSNATESGSQQVTVTILDDDVAPLPTVTLKAGKVSGGCGAGGLLGLLIGTLTVMGLRFPRRQDRIHGRAKGAHVHRGILQEAAPAV